MSSLKTDGSPWLPQHGSSVAPITSAKSWEFPLEQRSKIAKSLGPKHFTTFPNHQYFVRVYRPLAVSLALLNRRRTFLSEPDWMSTPWENHPKSAIDELLGIMLCLPCIMETLDGILPLPATMTRRLKAHKLLQSILLLETQFYQWLSSLTTGAWGHDVAYWSEDLDSHRGEIPFENPFVFRDGLTGLTMLYYWMSLILLHRCIESVHSAIFQPVVDGYPDMWPDLPPSLQIDPTQYQDGREHAANICRGLDAVLNSTTQPEGLLPPVTAALDFYRDINATAQDGVYEIFWLEAFKRRLTARGQHIVVVLQEQRRA